MFRTIFIRLRSAALVLCGYRPATAQFDDQDHISACCAAELIADLALSRRARSAGAFGGIEDVCKDWDFIYTTAYAGIVLYVTRGADKLWRLRHERTERRARSAYRARYLVWLEKGGEEAALITLEAEDEAEVRAVTEFLLSDGPDRLALPFDPVTATQAHFRIARVERLEPDAEPTDPTEIPF